MGAHPIAVGPAQASDTPRTGIGTALLTQLNSVDPDGPARLAALQQDGSRIAHFVVDCDVPPGHADQLEHGISAVTQLTGWASDDSPPNWYLVLALDISKTWLCHMKHDTNGMRCIINLARPPPAHNGIYAAPRPWPEGQEGPAQGFGTPQRITSSAATTTSPSTTVLESDAASIDNLSAAMGCAAT
jgi:hypothetical protein